MGRAPLAAGVGRNCTVHNIKYRAVQGGWSSGMLVGDHGELLRAYYFA